MKKERKPHETLKLFFGEKWINKRIEKTKLDGFDNLNPMNLAKTKIHPLIKAIIGTQIKLARSKYSGKTPIALESDELLQSLLHENLTILEPILDLPDWQIRLRDKKEFPKAEYELAIAAGYARTGNIVNFIPRSTDRTGEFYVVDKTGNEVLVECKKKDMTGPKQNKISNWWNEFQYLIMEKLKANSKSIGVAIHIPLDPKKEELSKIVEITKKLISDDCEGEKKFLKERYKITLTKLNSETECNEFGKDADYGVTRFLKDRKTRYVSYQMKIVGYSPSEFIDEKIKSVIDTLGQAYGQLEDGKPNIVYIDINVPSMTPESSAKIIAKLPSAIKRKLSRDYSKISAVVLTNLKLLKFKGAMGFHAEENVIHNDKATNKVPNEFKIYGDIDNGHSILEDMRMLFKK